MKNTFFKNISMLVAVSILLAACGSRVSVQEAKSNLQRDTHPSVAQSDIAAAVDGNNAFALDLYQSLRSQDGNLILSPYSISLALAMTYAGARGETESQMMQALHFLPQDREHSALNALDLKLAQSGKSQNQDQQPLQLNIANALWAEQTYKFQQDYLDLIARDYGAGIQLADFIHQYEPARKDINQWVSDQTKNKIQNLLPQGTVNSDTRMVLVNAIYFKADWDTPFDPNSTSDSQFNLLDGSQTQVKMMYADLSGLPYVQGDGYQAIELPYSGDTAAMDVLVPDSGKFDSFEGALDSQKLNDILNSLQPNRVHLGIPKFTYSSEFGLSKPLESLGMKDAFDPNAADFSGMTGQRDLSISDVVHKAFVAVDEKGTEAAAATGVIMRATSALLPSVSLTIDRPFIFIIRDATSGQILFVGRVLNPAQ